MAISFLRSGNAEELRQLLVHELAADHAQAASVVRRTLADVLLARRVVKVNPAAVGAGNDALRAQHKAVFAAVQLREHGGKLVLTKLAHRLRAPGDKHFVRVVAVMVVMMMAAAAHAVLIIMMMVLVLLILVVVVMMLMLVLIIVVMVVVMMLVLVFLIVVVVVVMMMVAASSSSSSWSW